ncbi:MAG: hypothetical protein EBR82_67025 [Caulobacteraceae bacterium]|nr:hypothetical protein [Caulobacteraceae bacterium]
MIQNMQSFIESVKSFPEAQNLSEQELNKFISDKIKEELDKHIQKLQPIQKNIITSEYLKKDIEEKLINKSVS